MGALEQGPLPLAATIAEVRAYLRMGAGIDDAVLAGLLRGASALCEQFTGQTLVMRDVRETLPVSGAWQRLSLCPVSAIIRVEGVPAEGAAFPLAISDYAIDLDPQLVGLVRVVRQGAAGRVRISYRAGMVASAGEVPDTLRQGIVMTAAQLHRERDGDGASGIPDAVMALWQPWRRVRIS